MLGNRVKFLGTCEHSYGYLYDIHNDIIMMDISYELNYWFNTRVVDITTNQRNMINERSKQ